MSLLLAGIHPEQLRDFIILPAITTAPNLDSVSAEILLLATCAHESKMGRFLSQYPFGPALGIFQMESATWRDNWRWLCRRQDLKEAALKIGGPEPTAQTMVYNLRFAAYMARIHYWRRPESLPEPGDLSGLWHYYKKYYNTHLGAAKEDDFLEAFHIYVAPLYQNERISFA